MSTAVCSMHVSSCMFLGPMFDMDKVQGLGLGPCPIPYQYITLISLLFSYSRTMLSRVPSDELTGDRYLISCPLRPSAP